MSQVFTRAIRLHDRFKRRVVTILPDGWTITRSRIFAYAMIEQKLPPSDATQ
jgi:hypothetical protein